ncbi:MAG TPA: S1/P1 nuclease, partial [Pyrinomonadaceae bacterium]
MKNERKFQSYKIRIALGLLALMLCTPSLSLGWGAGGHMMVASIAYKRLNPRAKAKVNELLAIPINPANVSAKSKDFVNAAHWADDLRPFAEFDGFKALHFIDTPFSTDGTPTAVHAPTPNIVTALQDNVKILRTSADTNAQAQALRLIIHFVGDIHQPLHCATKVSSANPDGDRGGNLVSIIIPGEGKAKVKKSNLHSYWDGGLGTFPTTGPNFAPPPLSQIPAAAIKAMKDNSANDPQLRLDNP